MKFHTSKEIIARIDRHLADPRLESEAQLRKRWAWIWMVVTFVGSLSSVAFFLFVLNYWEMFWFSGTMIAGFLVAFPLFRWSVRFDLVMNILYSFFIIITFFAILQSGGLTTSMGFVFIGINCAMGSVLAGNVRWTIGLFILYCLTIILVGIFQPFLITPDYLTPAISTFMFVFLTLWINACIFFLVVLFMKLISKEKS